MHGKPLNQPSTLQKLGSMVLFAMDSSGRWNDENVLVQNMSGVSALQDASGTWQR
jgi:hypothetical protein